MKYTTAALLFGGMLGFVLAFMLPVILVDQQVIEHQRIHVDTTFTDSMLVDGTGSRNPIIYD